MTRLAVPAGNKTRSSAKAASNIENMLSSTGTRAGRESLRMPCARRYGTHRPGQDHRQCSTRRLAKRGEPISNCIGETAMRVMTGSHPFVLASFASLGSVATSHRPLICLPDSAKCMHPT